MTLRSRRTEEDVLIVGSGGVGSANVQSLLRRVFSSLTISQYQRNSSIDIFAAYCGCSKSLSFPETIHLCLGVANMHGHMSLPQ